MAAARALTSERPGDQITIRAVAERAGYDPALVTYYFGNKAGLLEAVLEDAAAEFLGEIERGLDRLRSGASAGGGEEGLAVLLGPVIEFNCENPELQRMSIQHLLSSSELAEQFFDLGPVPYLRRLEAWVKAEVKSGTLRAVDARVLATTLTFIPLMFTVMELVVRRAFGEELLEPAVRARYSATLTDLLLHGALPPGPTRPTRGTNGERTRAKRRRA